MITQKMRKVLEKKLGYLREEVDLMEPQIAAVLIERSLPRPSKGIPESWKRTEFIEKKSLAILRPYFNKLQNSFKSLKDFSVKHIQLILPSIFIVAIAIHQPYQVVTFPSTIKKYVFSVFKQFKKIFLLSKNEEMEKKSVLNSNKINKKKSDKHIENYNSKNKKSKKNRIDLDALELARHLSFFDKIKFKMRRD
jgi:hypothetical protein